MVIDTVMEVFVICVSIGIFILVITGNFGWVWDKVVPFFANREMQIDTYYDAVAYSSASTLSCAVDIVGTGTQKPCFSSSKRSPVTGNVLGWSSDNGLTGFAAASLDNLLGGKGQQNIEDIEVNPADQAYLDCKTNGNAVSSCTVHNFQLKQYVTKWNEWILKYGDPQYLVYWNMFPNDEDTWTFKPDWKIHFIIAAVSVFPVSKVGSIGLKLGFTAVTRQGVKAALKKYLVEFAKKRFLTLKELSSVVAKWALLETGAAGLSEIDKASGAMTDSMLKKYEPKPNSMVLKVPDILSNEISTFALSNEMENTPVMVKWVPEETTEIKNAHLVSPCYLDSFDVKRATIKCGTYAFNREANTFTCADAEEVEPDKCELKCGEIDRSIDDYFGLPIYETLSKVIKLGDRTMYQVGEIKENQQYADRLYLPWYSSGGDTLYLSDIDYDMSPSVKKDDYAGPYGEFYKEAQKQLELDLGIGQYFSKPYVATLYKGGEKAMGLVSVKKDDDIIMEPGKNYVLDIYFVKEPGKGLSDILTDVYPVEVCRTKKEMVVESKVVSRMTMSCDEVLDVTDSASSIDDVKNHVRSAFKDENRQIIRFTPSTEVRPKDLITDLPWAFDPVFGADDEFLVSEYYSTGRWHTRKTPLGCYKDDGVDYMYYRRQCFRTIGQPVEVKLTLNTYAYFDSSKKGHTMLLYIEANYGGFNVQFTSDRSADEGKLSIQKVYLDEGRKYIATFLDENNDGKWDTIAMSKNEFLGSDNFIHNLFFDPKLVSVSDISKDGSPSNIVIRGCCTNGVLLDLTKLGSKKTGFESTNYCLRYTSKGMVVLKWAGRAVGIAGIIAAGFFTGGGAWVAALGISAGTVLAEATTETITEYAGSWP